MIVSSDKGSSAVVLEEKKTTNSAAPNIDHIEREKRPSVGEPRYDDSVALHTGDTVIKDSDHENISVLTSDPIQYNPSSVQLHDCPIVSDPMVLHVDLLTGSVSKELIAFSSLGSIVLLSPIPDTLPPVEPTSSAHQEVDAQVDVASNPSVIETFQKEMFGSQIIDSTADLFAAGDDVQKFGSEDRPFVGGLLDMSTSGYTNQADGSTAIDKGEKGVSPAEVMNSPTKIPSSTDVLIYGKGVPTPTLASLAQAMGNIRSPSVTSQFPATSSLPKKLLLPHASPTDFSDFSDVHGFDQLRGLLLKIL